MGVSRFNFAGAIKLVLISAIVLFGILTFLFLAFPGTVRVSRIQVVAASRDRVRNILINGATWKRWNLLTTPVAGDSPSVGTKIYSGDMRVDITGIAEDSVLTIWRSGNRSFKSVFSFYNQAQGTVVRWEMIFPLRWYPWERLASMFYEKRMGPPMDSSLSRFRVLAEQTAVNYDE